MERLDLRLVEYFVAVAEELHFGRAAERLHIAQPSLSQQIRRLETQLDVQLLERTSRRVEITPAGEAMLREGRRLLEHAGRLVHAVRTAGAEQLVVGFYGSAASLLLTDVLRTFSRRQPNVAVAVRELELSHVEAITSGPIDVAFTRLAPGEAELEIEVLLREPRVVALPAEHPLAARGEVEYASLRGERFITGPQTHNPSWRAQWLAEQRRHGLPGEIAAEAASVQEILTLVASGRGVCLVPAAAARLYPRSDVTYVPVRDAEPAIVSLAWLPERSRAATESFLKTAREVAQIHAAAALEP
jgi:DNA-binding transcriptional LysR family regulator